MTQFTGIVFFTLFILSRCIAQDIITTKSGEDILAKVLEVNPADVKYKKYDNSESPIYTILKSDLVMIRYDDGTKDIFTDSKVSIEGMLSKGEQDAFLDYTGRNSGSVWTGVTTALFSPLVGVIPAAICASTAPSDRNLRGDRELMKNREYRVGYSESARKIKKRKVWSGFAYGSGIWLILVLSSNL
jgi:hypothetical protein